MRSGVIFAVLMLWPVLRRLGVATAVVRARQSRAAAAGGRAPLAWAGCPPRCSPSFLALAAMLPRRAVTPLITAWALGQGLVAALFFTWRPLF